MFAKQCVRCFECNDVEGCIVFEHGDPGKFAAICCQCIAAAYELRAEALKSWNRVTVLEKNADLRPISVSPISYVIAAAPDSQKPKDDVPSPYPPGSFCDKPAKIPAALSADLVPSPEGERA